MVLLNLPGISQTFPSRDSTTIANKDLKKAVILIEQGKQTLEELKYTQRQVNLLEQRVSIKDSVIVTASREIDTHKRLIDNHTLIEQNYEKEITLQKQSIVALEKSLKRGKTKRKIITVVSLATIGYLLLK